MRDPDDGPPRDAAGHLISEMHGVTLAAALEKLVATLGWDELAGRIRVRCFAVNPNLKSSLTFLRRTPWARKRVEELYVETAEAEARRGAPRP